MKLLRRFLLMAAAIVLVPLAMLVGHVGWNLGLSFLDRPARSLSLAHPGLASPVEITLDADEVPHIRAATQPDAAFALGWLHARDRFFQMETQRRLGAGRVAELLGPPALPIDRLMRKLGFYRLAEGDVAALPPALRDQFTAYAAGVNHWLQTGDAPLPLELRLLLAEPEPWALADSLVWGKLIALQLSHNYRDELRHAARILQLGEERYRELFVPGRPPGPTTVQDRDLAGIDWPRLAARAGNWPGGALASNILALAPSRTADGAALLANDPHLALSRPVLWYPATIEVAGERTLGATVPGVPFHVIGQNDGLAWGVTTTGGDVQDLVVERLDTTGAKVRHRGAWEAIQSRDEVIRVRFAPDETLVVRRTAHGPLISDIDEEMAASMPEGRALALAWPALEPGDRSAEALWRVGRARTVDEALEALRLYRTPQQNFMLADKAGAIAFIAAGQVPRRTRSDGLTPVAAPFDADDAPVWDGSLAFEELPRVQDPTRGWLANANNAIVPESYPHHLGFDGWAAPYRALRLDALMAGLKDADPAAAGAALLDTRSSAADDLLPAMMNFPPGSARQRRALAMLGRWNRDMRRELAAPLLFNAWLERLGTALLADDLDGSLIGRGTHWPGIIGRILREAPEFCDDRGTEWVESCADQQAATLDRALDDLMAAYGDDMSAWRWGEAHRAPLAHLPLGSLPLMGGAFRADLPMDGGNWTLLRAAWFAGDGVSFPARHGAGYRGVYHLGDPALSRFMMAGGPSGRPLLPGFSTFNRRWVEGEWRPFLPPPGPALGTIRMQPASD